MQLPKSQPQYDQQNESQTRGIIERDAKSNVKIGQALERMLFQSPDGTKWYLSVSNAGAPVVTAA